MKCSECLANNNYKDNCEWVGVNTVCPQAKLYWEVTDGE